MTYFASKTSKQVAIRLLQPNRSIDRYRRTPLHPRWEYNKDVYLPANQELPDHSELGFRKSFGEDVCPLLLGTDVLGHNAFVFANLTTEE